MPLKIPNLSEIRGFTPEGSPQFGRYLYEALRSVMGAHNQIEQQTNSASNAQRVAAPPPIDAISVNGQNGHFQIAITDQNNIYAGVKYFAAHADNPGFTDAHIIDLGASRNHSIFLGNTSRYWMGYSSYGNSPPSTPKYHGGIQPAIVQGGGTVGGPAFQASQGSGTGSPGVALSGVGPIAYRSSNGKAPTRA